MSRRARRLTDPMPLRHPHRSLPIEAIFRWAGVALSLAVAASLTHWLEGSGIWSGLRSSIESLDFDPIRAALILAWLAGVMVAAVATLLGGGPRVAALSAARVVA